MREIEHPHSNKPEKPAHTEPTTPNSPLPTVATVKPSHTNPLTDIFNATQPPKAQTYGNGEAFAVKVLQHKKGICQQNAQTTRNRASHSKEVWEDYIKDVNNRKNQAEGLNQRL